MSDRAVFAMALAAATGARLAMGVPLPGAVAIVLVALAGRRPWLLVVGAALLASALGHRAWAGLDPPEDPVRIDRSVTLVSDPDELDGAVRVDVRVGPRRVEAWARGEPAAQLRARLAGEQLHVRGTLAAAPERARARLARRHIAARLSVDHVGAWSRGSPVSTLANGVRRTLSAGAEVLDDVPRSLFAGLVLGDRRGQPAGVADDFRGAGLSHLLAVSGQNVAFVLVLSRPVLGRLGLTSRLAVTIGLLGFFALVTRWEPSVLRACAMAGVAAAAFTLGRPSTRGRILALAVTAVLLVDPLLVGSVAFLLSVGASAAIVFLAGPIAARMPGPRIVVEPLAVTLAAQIGVAPVLIPVFGGVPLASLPANLLAGPAAGPVMMWGLTGGLVAGVAPVSVARLLHAPTEVLIGWIAGVARLSAGLPLGRLRAEHLPFVVVAAAAVVLARRLRRPRLVAAAAVAGIVALGAGAARPQRGVLEAAEVATGAVVWRDGGVVVVIGRTALGPLLGGLRDHGIRRIDVLVVTDGASSRTAETVLEVRRRLSVRTVLAPGGHRIRDAFTPTSGTPFVVGRLRVQAVAAAPRLRVSVTRLASPP